MELKRLTIYIYKVDKNGQAHLWTKSIKTVKLIFALVMKVVSLLSPCCRSPSKPLILSVLPGTKPYYFRARVHCLTCSCCGLIDFSLNPVSCSDSFSLSLETRGQLTGHSPLPHSLPMIHLVYSPKFCISSFSLSLWTTVISRRNENNLYDILFFWGGGGEGVGDGVEI